MLHRTISSLLGVTLCLSLGALDTAQRFGARCLQARGGQGAVRILHFGDSHLACREASEAYRAFFQGQYGNGGPGLGLPWVAPMAGVRARASQGWTRGQRARGKGGSGLAGAFLETRKAGEWAGLEGAFSRFRLSVLGDPAGGSVDVRVDGVPQGTLDLAGPADRVLFLDRVLSPGKGPRKLEVRTLRAGAVRILGIALEGSAGAVYSPLAFNGAQADWMLGVPEGVFRAQVEAQAPDLVVLAFGTNEASGRDFQAEAYRKNLEALLGRFRKAAPQAAMLLVGPPDGRLKGRSGALEGVVAVQRAVATAFRATFVDQRQAMGGPGSMEDWFAQGLGNRDRIHLTPAGYQRLSRHCLQGLLSATGQTYALPALARVESVHRTVRAASTPSDRVPEAHPLLTYRSRDGRLLITDNPAQVDAGEWIRETSP